MGGTLIGHAFLVKLIQLNSLDNLTSNLLCWLSLLQPIERVLREFPPIMISSHAPSNGVDRPNSSDDQRSSTVQPAARERISSSSSGTGVSPTDGGVASSWEGGGASVSKPRKVN